MNNDYIILAGKIFSYANRSMTIETIGTGVQRTIGATGFQSIVARKRTWQFELGGDQTFYLRVLAIYNTNTELAFTDYDGSSYTVLWNGNFSPVDESVGDTQYYTIQLTLTEK